MPTISPIPFDSKFISLSVERDAVRSPGIHLSTILRDMLVTAGIQRKYGKPLEEGEQKLVFEQGFLWERMVMEYLQTPVYQQYEMDRLVEIGLKCLLDDESEASGGVIVRPGEQQLDGIYLTPDAINTRLWHYEEWKSTSIRAANLDIAKRKPEWLWQCAANCKVFNMTRAVIRVWHTGEFPQVVKQWVVDWSTEEIDWEWQKIKDHYEYMKSRNLVTEFGTVGKEFWEKNNE